MARGSGAPASTQPCVQSLRSGQPSHAVTRRSGPSDSELSAAFAASSRTVADCPFCGQVDQALAAVAEVAAHQKEHQRDEGENEQHAKDDE